MTRFHSLLFFYGWVIYFYISIFITTSYPFIYWLVLRLLPYPGYCKQRCNKHRCTCIFFWIPRSGTDGLYVLGWCKSNYGFALLNFAIWYCKTFLNKCGYVIHHFNMHSLLYCFLLWLIQFSSVAQLCPTPCEPMDCSIPGSPVHHQFLEFTQTQVHWVSDAIQPIHPSTFNLSQHQRLFKWVSSSNQVAKVLRLQLQHQSFQWIFRTDFL